MEENKEIGIHGLSPDGKSAHHDRVNNDPEMEGLTLYEKKALLVNRELNSHGMGKYQWYLVTVRVFRHDTTNRFQVYLAPLRNGIHGRSALRASFRLGRASIATGIGLLQWVLLLKCVTAIVESFAASEGGDLFSSFNAGLCAGVDTISNIYRKTQNNNWDDRRLFGVFL